MRQRSFILALAAGLMAFNFGAVSAEAGSELACEAEDKFGFILKADGMGKIAITFSDASLTQINPDPIPAGSVVSQLPGHEGLVVNSSDTVPRGTSYSQTATSRAQRSSASVRATIRLRFFWIAALAVWLLIRL
jgi:hypothetical protein